MDSAITKIKQRLFTNWHTMRWTALAISLFFAALGFLYKDVLTGLLSAFFFFQAITNTGCMVAQTCGAPVPQKQGDSDPGEIEYSEVKKN